MKWRARSRFGRFMFARPARICTCCPIPHETTDYYVIEPRHPRRGEIECAEAHERRIPLEVRDFGQSSPPARVLKPVRLRPAHPGKTLAELLRLP